MATEMGGMMQFIFYLFEAEDTSVAFLPEMVRIRSEKAGRVLMLVKTLMWMCIAVAVGIVIGHL